MISATFASAFPRIPRLLLRMPMKLAIPEFALVALVGASGSGKSTFARKHFRPTEIISSDFCRGLVSDDENDQSATRDAFDVVYFIAEKRLTARRFTVIDATNVQREARLPIIELARRFNCALAAIVLNLPEEVCRQRNFARPDRTVEPHVISRQHENLRRSIPVLESEGFRPVSILSSQEEIDGAIIERIPA